mgnify:CR=1 FL=1
MIILGTNSIKDTGYDVANSCRFNRASSDNLTKTPSGDGDRQKWTTSLWIKRSLLGSTQHIFTAGTYSESISIRDEKIYVQVSNNNTTAHAIQSNRLLRDISAWYHIVVACDTTQGTAANRLKLYVNGVEETSLALDQRSAITQNMSTAICGQFEHRFGIDEGSTDYYSGYIAEAVLIDGQQLAPDQFGEFDEDSGIWKPIDVSGLTFGTNGFYLDFEDSAALGDDVSGNGNDFTVNNLTAVDQSIDTCTNNFATLNPLNSWGGAVLSEGNLKLTSTATAFDHTSATIHMNSGKWYMEFNQVATSGGSAVACFLAGTGEFQNDQTSWISSEDGGFGIGMNGFKITDGVEEDSNSFSAVSSGDIVQIAYDSDTGKAWFGINNSWLASGNPSTNADPYFTSSKLQNNDVSLKLLTYTSNNTSIANFGQDSSFAGTKTKQSNQDSNSQGNFFYAPPTDFLALNTKNLAEYG